MFGQWYGSPATVLMDQGPSQMERRLTEKITLMNVRTRRSRLKLIQEAIFHCD